MLEKYKIQLYVASLRLERWPRSLAIFPGLVLALLLEGGSGVHNAPASFLIRSLVAFFCTWMISTANYIVNEITDAPYDAFHPQKRERPLVQKQIRRRFLILFGLLITATAFFIAIRFFSWSFFYALMVLLGAGILYNVKPIRIKDIPYLDSILESANNPIRFLIGWYILNFRFPDLALLISWWAFGNFLMVGKRVAEKKFLTDEESTGYRKSLAKYSMPGLVGFMIGTAILFLVFFISFALRFQLLMLVYALPLIIVYLVIFMRKSLQDRDTAEEPERLLKNPYFAAFTFVLMILFILAFLSR